MTNAHSDSWGWFLESQQFRDLLAKAIDTPIDHKLIMGDGMFANHTFGCAFAQRGADCDCVAVAEGDEPDIRWRQDGPVIIDWSHREPTRGIDYSRYTAAEGINEEEGE